VPLLPEGVLAQGLQALAAVLAAFVGAVAVGAFHDDDVGAVGRLRRRQQGGVGRAQVAGEDDAPFVRPADCFEFHVGGAEDVAGRGELDAQPGVAFDDGVPRLVGQGDDLLRIWPRKRSIRAWSRVKPTFSASSSTSGSRRRRPGCR
jgi:hypothetical protein